MTFFYKFWKKALVYYTLSISRGGGGRPPGPPGFATDYIDVSEPQEEDNTGYIFKDLCISKFYGDEPLLDLTEKKILFMYNVSAIMASIVVVC